MSGFDDIFPYVFPFFFVVFWTAIGSLLGVMSGWFSLQQRYPKGEEPALLTLRARSGSMGLGVHLNGVLRLSACRSGLRIGLFRLFGPFQRPFLVPWGELTAEPARRLFVPAARLRLGHSGTLVIDARDWQRLLSAAQDAGAVGGPVRSLATAHRQGRLDSVEPVSIGAVGRGMLLQWLAVTAAAGSFFLLASHAQAGGPPIPPAVCYGFPGIVFGIGQFVRFLRQIG